jgi:hypothetical protein
MFGVCPDGRQPDRNRISSRPQAGCVRGPVAGVGHDPTRSTSAGQLAAARRTLAIRSQVSVPRLMIRHRHSSNCSASGTMRRAGRAHRNGSSRSPGALAAAQTHGWDLLPGRGPPKVAPRRRPAVQRGRERRRSACGPGAAGVGKPAGWHRFRAPRSRAGPIDQARGSGRVRTSWGDRPMVAAPVVPLIAQSEHGMWRRRSGRRPTQTRRAPPASAAAGSARQTRC